MVKSTVANLLHGTHLDNLLRPRALPVVVGYHRVVEDFASSSAESIPSMLVSVKMLERHLDWIGRRYRFVSLDELGACLQSNPDAAGRLAAVTFDDGYQDFYDHAVPLLTRKGIPGAVFVVTDHAGTSRVQLHDKLYLLLSRRNRTRAGSPHDAFETTRNVIETLPQENLEELVRSLESDSLVSDDCLKPFRSLSWEALARVQSYGFTVGSHTRSHVLMTNESPDRVREEAAGSRREIERRLGTPVRHFAYPSSRFDETAVAAVAEAGYCFGYTGCLHRSPSHPMLTIPRTLLWEQSSLNSLGAFSGPVLNCQIHYTFERAAGCRQQHLQSREAWQ